MSEINDDYYKKVESWLQNYRKNRISRQNTRHPVMMYLRTKSDEKIRELYPELKSVFDENIKPNRYILFKIENHLKYIYPVVMKYSKMKELANNSYSFSKEIFKKLYQCYLYLQAKIDNYYVEKLNQSKEISNVKEINSVSNFSRIYKIIPNDKYRIESEKDPMLKEIYKKELLNKKILRELRILRVKNVFAESFFIKKTYVVENAFKKIQKDNLNIDKHYTIFYKLYKISFGQVRVNFKKLPRYFPVMALVYIIKHRYDFYKKQIGNDKIYKIKEEKPINLYGDELDKKFLETYKIEQELLENSVILSEYANNKEYLNQKHKETFPTLMEFYDECMLSDLRFLLFTYILSVSSCTVFFFYNLKKKRYSWKKSFFNSILFYYLFREITEYSQILNYIQYQDQLARFILTKGDSNKEDIDEMLKYGFFRKNINKI